MANIKISREWAMPNKNTFSIKPIEELIKRYHREETCWIDPFCGHNKWAHWRNDLNPDIKDCEHMDALAYLKTCKPWERHGMYFDPPYSPRQISECYKSVGIKTNMQTTQSSWYSDIKDEIARIIRPNNLVISASWNSNGIGKSRGFEIIEILIVAHGGWHNDTIVTVERKINNELPS